MDVVVVCASDYDSVYCFVSLDGFLGVDVLEMRESLQHRAPVIIVVGLDVGPLASGGLAVLRWIGVIAVHQLVEQINYYNNRKRAHSFTTQQWI